jgi:hypothetical protein
LVWFTDSQLLITVSENENIHTCENEATRRQPTIRKTTASGGGSTDMNNNSHGSPEEERR